MIRWTELGGADQPDSWVAHVIASTLADAIAQRGRAVAALCGGNTPRASYAALNQQPVDWSRVTLTLTDERWVSPQDNLSNERMLREALLSQAAAAAKFVGLWSDADTIAGTARSANQAIGALVRPFDLTLLGMGEDGHFASLFPGASGTAGALQADTESLVVAIEPVAGSPRLSMTLSCLLQSRRILLLISGQRKRQVLEQAQSSMNSRQLPIAALLAIKKPDIEIIWVNT